MVPCIWWQQTDLFHGPEDIPEKEHIKQKFHIRNGGEFTLWRVPKPTQSLDKQLAVFLKKTRGDTSYAEFSKKTGLPASTLFRLENCQQSITLGKLEQVMNRLKVTLGDVFGSSQ